MRSISIENILNSIQNSTEELKKQNWELSSKLENSTKLNEKLISEVAEKIEKKDIDLVNKLSNALEEKRKKYCKNESLFRRIFSKA